MHRDRSIPEMEVQVMAHRAKLLGERTGQALESALGVLGETEAGQQLRELANGEYRHEKAWERQASAHRERLERELDYLFGSLGWGILLRLVGERHYSWVAGYLEWLEGKEARAPYHALLEEELASLQG